MNTLKQIESAARSLKLKLPFTLECDPAHDLIDRIIELCGESAQDSDLEALRVLHYGVESAYVVQYQVGGRWLAVRIPRHQPFGQQVEWCKGKGATHLEVSMNVNGSEKLTAITEIFNINYFSKQQ